MRKILVIVGPTASGKSALAVKLAKQRHGEIISADSRQVYTGLNIGTGKITKREMKGVRHHLLDVASPKKIFTAHDFVRIGRAAIKDIHARGKLPIICGGTGFYIDALLGLTSLSETERNDVLRKRLANKTAAQLYAILQKRDPARATRMDTPSERNNAARLIRALEVAAANRKPQIALDTIHYNIEWIGVDWPDAKLRKRIHTRLLSRIKGGMVAEAKNLHSTGLSWRRMEELGLEYRYLARYLRGTISKADMLAQLENEIWRYTKRQRTWWKRNPDIHWTIRT